VEEKVSTSTRVAFDERITYLDDWDFANLNDIYQSLK
jgi:hypothetical protein